MTATLPPRLVDLDEEYPATLEEAARFELQNLWHDLNEARSRAIDGCWSIACGSLVYRIVALSRLAGALPWEHVQVELLRSGLYERIHQEAGIEYPPIDWDRVAAFEARRRPDGSWRP